MSYRPHYIASFDADSGLNTYYEPFLIPEKAFPRLEDCFCFRGKVKRKPGTTLIGRLRRAFTNTAITNIDSTTVNINLFTELGIAGEPNAQIEPGSLTLTIAAPIGQVIQDLNSNGILTVAPAGIITAAQIDYFTGVLSLTFGGAIGASAALLTVAYFPGLPVTGIRTQELPPINEENTISFDTKYAYQYNSATHNFSELPSVAVTTWTGASYNLFWTTNYGRNVNGPLFWATNSNISATPDHIKYYDTTTWTNFEPQVHAGVFLEQSHIILPYKDRLLFINTYEGANIANTVQYPQRVRFSWNGDPTNANAFRDDIPGYGGYIDAPTNEVIISAEYIKDTLLIKFERSSWKLVYTGNEVLPFVFQKINTELGVESKFSLVPFDRGVFGVGNFGITSDDSVNVERIDLQIPNIVFNINNNNAGVQRVYGIRDYVNELVYWAYPTSNTDTTFPNKVLSYNYRNNTYSIFNNSFTCYGYFQLAQGYTWATLPYPHWSDWLATWASGILQSQYPLVAAGNQQGYISYINDTVTNDASLYISTINFGVDPCTFVSPNHNLRTGDIVVLSGISGGGTEDPAALNGNYFRVTVVDPDTISLEGYHGGSFFNLFVLGWCDPGSTYYGGGQIRIISGLNITTKVFSPYYEYGSQCRLGYIDYLTDRTDQGEVTIDVYVDESPAMSVTDPMTNPCLLGSAIVNTAPDNIALIPQQAIQNKIWHRQYVQAIAQNIQIAISLSDVQKCTDLVTQSDYVLHAIAIYLSPNARMVQ